LRKVTKLLGKSTIYTL